MITDKDIVDKFIQQELALAEIYAFFAEQIPELNRFWRGLVIEEQAHAEVLEILSKTEGIYIDREKFRLETLESGINHIKNQLSLAKSENIDAERSLAIASSLESSLIENEYFELIKSSSSEIQVEIDALNEHTITHLQRIRNEQTKEPPFNEEPKTAQTDDEPEETGINKVSKAQLLIIEDLIKAEEAVAVLYNHFSIIFPDMFDFWEPISEQETLHASELISIKHIMQKGKILYNMDKVNSASVKCMKDAVDTALSVAQDGRITKLHALSLALGIETSIVEHKFFSTVKSNSDEVISIARSISSDTKNHADSLRSKITEIQKSMQKEFMKKKSSVEKVITAPETSPEKKIIL